MHEILFIKTSSLGDVIHMMPAVSDARRHFPRARLAWVVEQAFAPLVRQHPAIDEVIPVAWRGWRSRVLSPSTWREMRGFSCLLRSHRYDAVVDSQGLIRSAVIAKLASGPRLATIRPVSVSRSPRYCTTSAMRSAGPSTRLNATAF